MIDRKQLLALLAVFAVVSQLSVAAVAAGGLGLNTEADQYPETTFTEDRLTIEEHDRSTMSWLQYEDDNGKIQTIDANVNGSASGAEVAYRADQLEVGAFAEYPRKSAEANNSASWIDATEWSTSVSDTGTGDGDPANSLAVSDTDGATAPDVESITYNASDLGAGDTATATYGNQSITSDVAKRHLQAVLNVNQLAGVVEIQIHDADGDYVAAQINASAAASADNVIANQTGQGAIYQRQLGQFAVQGSGDGTLAAVEDVKIVTTDGDSELTVTGLNVQKKSQWDFGEERVPDQSTSDTGDYKDETVYTRPAGGQIEAADLAGLGSEFSDATVHKLQYIDVEYRMQDKPSAVSVEFRDAGDTYPSFDSVLDLSYRRTLPSAYDITHGNLTLETNQTFLSERYVTIRYAEGVGDTETENINDSEWIDLSGSLGDKGTWITADDTVSADTTYVIQIEPKLIESQTNTLEVQQAGGGGFWGSSGGGNPFMSLYNWVAGGIVGLLGALGLKSRAGS
jgi:hypothetical protein